MKKKKQMITIYQNMTIYKEKIAMKSSQFINVVVIKQIFKIIIMLNNKKIVKKANLNAKNKLNKMNII
jgi:hypothetical protein